MSGKLGRALEVMGWRVPEEDQDLIEEEFSTETVEGEVQLHAISGGAEPSVHSISTPDRSGRSFQRIMTLHPTKYSEATQIGDAFRDGVPVILNLAEMPENEATRVLDFASGVTYGLAGNIEKIAGRVFLMSPKGVEVGAGSPMPGGSKHPLDEFPF